MKTVTDSHQPPGGNSKASRSQRAFAATVSKLDAPAVWTPADVFLFATAGQLDEVPTEALTAEALTMVHKRGRTVIHQAAINGQLGCIPWGKLSTAEAAAEWVRPDSLGFSPKQHDATWHGRRAAGHTVKNPLPHKALSRDSA